VSGKSHNDQTKIALATLVGTTIEWYDFFIYGIAAALVFNSVFFPQIGERLGLLASLATFGVSFFARPIGGLLAGQLGDRIGRKSVLVFTLMLMGISSLGIGILPSYERIGIAAPVLLVALRFTQGLAVGGEWGGAAVMAVESAPSGQRGFWGSFPQMGGPCGLVLANSVMLITNAAVGSSDFIAWGWRLPFLASLPLLAVGLFIRNRIEDPAEAEISAAPGSIWRPLRDVLRERKAATFALVLAQAGVNIAFYIFSVAALTYLTKDVGISRNAALTAVMIGAAFDFILQPMFGALSDRVGRQTTMIGGNLFLCVMAYGYYKLTSSAEIGLVVLATVLGLGIGHAATYAPLSSLLAEQYETTSRYTGVSLANQLANLIWSAPTPFIAVYLSERYPGSTYPLSVLLVFAAILSIVGVIAIRPVTSR
jgi:MHS family shikimate/dehydroshikimate transporter-like MFS transporter